MEPATIIGLVGNIAQFLQFGFEFAVAVREVYNSATGTTEECDQLRLIIEDIKNNTIKLTKEGFAGYGGGKEVQKLADECKILATSLLGKLEKLTVNTKGWTKAFKSIETGFKASWNKNQTNDLLRRLIDLEGRLIRIWKDNQDHIQADGAASKLQSLEEQMKEQFRNLEDEIAQHRSELMLEMSTIHDEHEHFNTKFCFFIDGLDEYNGEEEDIMKVVKQLASSPSIKICTSSRPWPAFYAEWHGSRYTFLVQDFTRPDMEHYIESCFSENSRFQSLVSKDERYTTMVQSIAAKAQGVWLWVHLVVRDLLRDIRDNEPYELLQARLNSYPQELNAFFEKIFLRIDPLYRTETAQLFILATAAQAPMSIIALPFLGELNNSRSTFKANPELFEEHKLENLFRIWHPRLQNRCRDLMKLTKDDKAELWRRYQVEFLHRTVRDFLQDHFIMSLRRNLSESFHEWTLLCELTLVGLRSFDSILRHTQVERRHTTEKIDELIYYLRKVEEISATDHAVELVRKDLKFMEVEVTTSPESIRYWLMRDLNWAMPSAFLSLAAACGLTKFVVEMVKRDRRVLHNLSHGPVFHYALVPGSSIHPWCVNMHRYSPQAWVDLVEGLLNLGADPNMPLLRSPHATCWSGFVEDCMESWNREDDAHKNAAIRIMESMIHQGASLRVMCSGDCVSVFELLSQTLDPADMCRLEAAAPPFYGKLTIAAMQQFRRLRWTIPSLNIK
ncbi:hypothetical protein GGR57DRAFT_501065 [Xylariaceae sp. FL1272]|nr:hypothetical protein GGR57DRAFT_501065 [Xylariaceae sp. FL1272]